jgi:hypothetical protein
VGEPAAAIRASKQAGACRPKASKLF